MEMKELLGGAFLDRFKVYGRETLFEPYWDGLLKNLCPLCGNKLKEARKRPIFFCYGKKHGSSPFFIDKGRLADIHRIHTK